jgi:hypothetical protein
MQTEAIVALIVSGLALVGAIATALLSASKNDLEVLRGIIAELKDKIGELECENKDLKDWAERLVEQVKEAGLSPVKFIQRAYGKDKE